MSQNDCSPDEPTPQRRIQPGAMPGSFIVDPQAPPTTMRVITYNEQALHEREIEDVAEISSLMKEGKVTWVRAVGLGSAGTLEALRAHFGLHWLALEDVVNVSQRAKVEDYGEHFFMITRVPLQTMPLATEQVSIFFGRNFVLTFEERPAPTFEAVLGHLRTGIGRIRRGGPDYLAYALLDAAIDQYFPAIEHYEQRLEELEDQILAGTVRSVISEIQAVRRGFHTLHQVLWPQREALHALLRDSTSLVSEETHPYLRDTCDHLAQLLDLSVTSLNLSGDLINLHLNTVNSRISEVIKVLTIISTIFIPLTFIASIYGMNFDPQVSPLNMPELRWRYGYLCALAAMVFVALGLLFYFRRKGWLGKD